jgi:molybdopterin molybdotransferase
MISFEEALQIIESSVTVAGSEKIPLQKALNRILAQEVVSDTDMPPFDKSAMDGYACRRIDLGNELRVIEEIPAGRVPEKKISANLCARIMTGAMLPKGADYVLMQEHAELKDPRRLSAKMQSEHTNICYKGEDVKAGDRLLKTGTRLLPASMAILAAAGCVMPRVYQRPRLAIISTGDELIEPEALPVTGKIRNSNGMQLVAQALQFGLPADYLGIVSDNRQMLLNTLSAALEKYHVVLISGGVSVGDYDFVPGIISELQMDILIRGMNVKPGKHLLLSKKGSQYVVGMPGNPVSSFVLFEVLVKPMLRKLTGCNEDPVLLKVPLAKDYHRKNQNTLFFIPVFLTAEGKAMPVEYHGSAHIHAYSAANGIMDVPVGQQDIKEGEIVHVRPL